jgi:hypothetical protein
MEQLGESTKEVDQQSKQEHMCIDEMAAESSSREETGNGLPEESSSGAAGAGAGTTAAADRDQGFAIDQTSDGLDVELFCWQTSRHCNKQQLFSKSCSCSSQDHHE